MCITTPDNTNKQNNAAQVAPGQTNTVSPPYDPKVAQLSVAINTSPTPEQTDDSQQNKPALKVDDASTITGILKQIYGRLKGGLDPVWLGPDGHDPEWEPQPDMPDDIKKLVAAEEKWARLCSELLVGASYGSTTVYGAWKAKPKTKSETPSTYLDADYYKKFWGSDPVLPIYMACQQLCTFALLTRGLSTYDISGAHTKAEDQKPPDQREPKGLIGVSASNNSYLDHLFEGKWDPKQRYQNIEEAFARSNGPLTPGSMFAFLPPAKGNVQPQGSHVVFVLRAAYGRRKAQFLDTGAAYVAKQGRARTMPAPPSMQPLGAAGNYDNCLFGGDVQVRTTAGQVPFVGFGALKRGNPDDLDRGVAQGRLARPLGFARLAIFKRSARPTEKDILYVSPLVLMYEPAADANYPPSRYLWSLRAMPACKELQALWILRIPQGDLAGDLFRAGRSLSLADLLKIPGEKGMKTALWWTVAEDGCAYLHLRHKIQTKTVNGSSTNVDRYDGVGAPLEGFTRSGEEVKLANITAKLEALEPSKDYISPSVQGKVEPPSYFKPW